MFNHKLEGILASVVPVVGSLFYKNSAPHTSAERLMGTSEPLINNRFITPYVGDFPESFFIPAISGLVGDFIIYQGQKRDNKYLQKIGQYFPEISTTIVGAYFTLGETILPQILPGTADVKDVPAVIISSVAGYVISKIGRNLDLNKKVFDLFKQVE